MAADLGSRHASLALYGMCGGLLAEHEQPVRLADGPEAVLRWVLSEAERLVNPAIPLRGMSRPPAMWRTPQSMVARPVTQRRAGAMRRVTPRCWRTPDLAAPRGFFMPGAGPRRLTPR